MNDSTTEINSSDHPAIMITLREVTVLDRNSELFGMPTLDLMENAGHGAAKFIIDTYIGRIRDAGREPKVLLICGKGNNGGDGFVTARHLFNEGISSVEILLLARKDDVRSTIARENLGRIPKSVPVMEYDPTCQDPHHDFNMETFLVDTRMRMESADIVVDAMLGSGISGNLRSPYREVIEVLNDVTNSQDDGGEERAVVSMDIPSGHGGEIFVKADATVTFHDIKCGMEDLERVEIVDIGIPAEAQRFVEAGEFAYYPVPGTHSHKGDSGRLAVIGGGPFTGAPSLAAAAAYRTGTDLVRIAVPADIAPIIASYDMNFMVTPLGETGTDPRLGPEHLGQLAPIMDRADAVIIGPGLGSARETLDAVIELLDRHPETPAVIDADALTALAELSPERRRRLLENRQCILTPHRGEFSRLAGIPAKIFDEGGENVVEDTVENAVARFATEHGCTVLLKGSEDIIAGRGTGELKVNRTGHPSMTVGGTGDVLAGCCGSFLARKVPPFAAARMAAHLNGKAGESAFGEKGWGNRATDIVEELPRSLMELLSRYAGK